MNARLWTFLAAVVSLMGAAACTSPGEFEALDNSCVDDGNVARFDAPTRDEFCSGRVQTRLVHRLDTNQLGAPGKASFVEFQDPYIIWAEQEPNASTAKVRVFKTDTGLLFDFIQEYEVRLDSGSSLTAMSSTSIVEQDGFEENAQGFIALVTDSRRVLVRNMDLSGDILGEIEPPAESGGDRTQEDMGSEGSEGSEGSSGGGTGDGETQPEEIPSDEDSATPTPPSDGVWLSDSQRQAFNESQAALPPEERCISDRTTDDPFRISAVASLKSPSGPQRRYMIFSAGCLLSVMAVEPRVSQYNNTMAPFATFLAQARDVRVDEAQDRFYMAAGEDGLVVRSLSGFVSELDHEMEKLIPPDPPEFGEQAGNNGGNNAAPAGCDGQEPCASADPNCEDCGDSGDTRDLEPQGAFTPDQYDLDDKFYADDPAKTASLRVTKVSFAADGRVFYINEPKPDATRDEDKLTYLVSGRLDANGVLQERASTRLTSLNEDGTVDSFEWQLVGLRDSLVAILGNRQDAQGNTENGQIILFDAPPGVEPEKLLTLPTSGRIDSIMREGDQLWVVQPTEITAFDIQVGGNHLK
jgi:hypothetical protein